MSLILILYLPVFHRGYLELLQRYKGQLDEVYVLDEELIQEFQPLHREIRALDSTDAAHFVRSLGWFRVVMRLHKEHIPRLQKRPVVTLNDAVCRECVAKYFQDSAVSLDTVFLRWDQAAVSATKPLNFDRESTNEFDRTMMMVAAAEAEQSSDWWRQVGAVAVREGEIILQAHNHHLPSEHSPYLNGDPRDVVEAGKDSHLLTANHAERSLIAQAAREGIALKGSDIYVTVFPCPPCALQLAELGLTRLFFAGGHASLDGEAVLKAAQVELVWVKM